MKNIKIMRIDLAGKPENPTGICFLNSNKPIFITVFEDQDILDVISKLNPYLIVIDAPLSYPVGRCCLSNKCSCSKVGGHFRKAEIEMRKFGCTLPLTFCGMLMLTERGIKLAHNLKEKYNVIESHPKTIQKILGIEDPEKLSKYFDLLEDITEHELDAAFLVIARIYYFKNDFMKFGDEKEGIIILPNSK